MNNKLIPIVLTLVVGIILAGSVLMPVLNDATKTDTTFTNEGGFFPMSEILATDTGTHILSWDGNNRGVITVDGVEFNAHDTYGTEALTVLATESWLVRYWSSGETNEYIQVYNGTTWFGQSTDKSFSVTMSAGNATASLTNSADTTSTWDLTYTKAYMIDTEVSIDLMKKSTETPYVLGDSEIYAMGITTISGSLHLVKIAGNINDGVEISVLGVDGATVSNIVIDSTAVAGYNNLYTIKKITFDVDYDSQTTSCTYSYFVVPYSVTAELSQHLTPGQIALMGAIPVLVIVALLVVAVGVVARRNE